MSQNLTFAGTGLSPYTVPNSHTAYGGAAIQYAADGTSIFMPNTDSFLQLVDNEICAGICSAEITFNWNNAFAGNEVGFCLIDGSRTGASVIITPSIVRFRNETAGSGGSTIAQASIATTGTGKVTFKFEVDLSDGTTTIYKNGVSVLTGVYAGPTTGLRIGAQLYHASDNPVQSFDNLITVTSTTAKTITAINSGAGVRVGSTGNTINTLNMGALTALTIGGKAMTNLVGNTFDAPPFVDGQVYAQIGNRTAIASDSGGSASRSTPLLPPVGWSVQTLEAPLNTTSGVITGLTPAAQVGEQILIETVNGLITPQGVYQGDVDGSFQAVRIRLDGTVDIYNVHTVEPTTDTTPNAFGFNTPALAALGATVTSTNTTISGINAAAAVSVTGGLVSINGGAFVGSGTITNGQTIAARVTASNSHSTAVTATVNIGGVSAQFTVTTIAAPPDTTPNSFSINPITGAALSSPITSSPVTPVGYSAAAPLTVTGGTASINGGAFSASPGNISPGQSFVVRLSSPSAYSTQASATVSIGGVSAQFLVTTEVAPTAPPVTPGDVLYISNSRGGGTPDGSQSNPFPSLWAAKIATGYQGYWMSDKVFRIWAGDTFDDYIDQPDQICLGSNFIVEPWTDITNASKKPILTRAKRSFTWTFDSTNGVWVSDALSNIRYGGVILEDGWPLDWKIWVSSRAATAATMTDGSASFDNLTRQYLIKPRSGAPSAHTYAACAGLQNLRLSHAGLFTFRAIEFQLSSQGILLGGGGFDMLTGGWSLEDVDIRYCGASVDSVGAVALGNGIQILHNDASNGTSYVRRSRVFDCFDSGFSPQLWDAGTIKGIEFEDCEAHRCGLTGFETSITSEGGTFTNSIENVNFRRCLAKDIGKGFAGNRYGSTANGYSFLSNDPSPNSHVKDCGLYDSRAVGCVGVGAVLPHAGGAITISRNLFAQSGGGIRANTKTGFGSGTNYQLTENIIHKCGKGITFGNAASGLAAPMVATGNLIESCDIGISNEMRPNDTASATNNTIVNCGIAIKSNKLGAFMHFDNAMFGNANNYSGLEPGPNVLALSQPAISTNMQLRVTAFAEYDGIYLPKIIRRNASYGKPKSSTKKASKKMKTPSLKGIMQSTPEPERTLTVPLTELELYKFDIGIEKNPGATGTVEIWVKDVSSSNFEKIASIDLGGLTGKDYTPISGPFDAFRAVPIGVSGTFSFSCAAY